MRTQLSFAIPLFAFSSLASAGSFQYGDIFLSSSNGNVYRYSQTGSLLQTLNAGKTAFGLAFDPAGNLYVATGSSIQKFDNSGNSLGAFASGFPGTFGTATDIDFDAAGNAYVVGIEDTNFDFVRSYTSGGSVISSGSVSQGQENWVYADYAGANTLLVTPGTTNIVDKVNATTLIAGPGGVFVSNGGPNGDIEGLASGGFLVITGDPIDEYDGSGNLVRKYNTSFPIHGTWIGLDQFTPTTFWATSDFGEVRQFNLGTLLPAASFDTSVNARALAVYTTTPEPSTIWMLLAGLVVLASLNTPRRQLGVYRASVVDPN